MRECKNFRRRGILGICALVVLCLMLFSPMHSVAQVEHDDLTGVKVGVFDGTGEMPSSRIALVRMFEWMGASVEEVTASQILGNYLDDCDILVFPGGSESSYMRDLEYITGIQKIQEFVQNGGSYFGICGGSTYGANTVDLFDGKMYPANEIGDLIHMSIMNVNQASIGSYLSDYDPSFTTMYYGSQFFVPDVGASVYSIAKYESNNKAGMIAFEYGHGTVFLSSPHPEYEEDSDRDDTTFGDELEDPDSEWDFLLRIAKWLVDASSEDPTTSTTTTTSTTSTTSTTTTTTATANESNTTTTSMNISTNSLDSFPFVGASAGSIMIVLGVVLLYRRTHG